MSRRRRAAAFGKNIWKNSQGVAVRVALNTGGILGGGYLVNVTIPSILYKNSGGVPPEGTKPLWSPIMAGVFIVLASAVKNNMLRELAIGAAIGCTTDFFAEYFLKDKKNQFGLSGNLNEALYGDDGTGALEYDPTAFMGIGAWQDQGFGGAASNASPLSFLSRAAA